ncbi:C40 family peptidase [Caulobacter mirabilis]|uniref:Hydrolase Nlp/P60 n=1 Tax=Caulobacter mirabilis TaxID=69666 RepID=A0A2D2B271_9CAUL|nr:NlpC/P60 family protein [Caulobacter mirabilis]ATQ44359.1 hydrolase Nlp/P60 [Caulobacter mirabilis]
MSQPDRRLTLIRDGVAARVLEGVVAADRYLDPTARQCAVTAAAIRKTPAPDAEQEDQLLFGEVFDMLLEEGGFSFGQARRDGYVGWVETAALHSPIEAATHRVHALRTYGFSRPDIKSRPIGLYTMNALVTVEAREGRFVKAVGSGWFIEAHLAPVGLALATDPATVAEKFLGAVYQWGGRESLGLDCSGLIQQALTACGRACPRDTDMQQAGLGTPIQDDHPRRGDLVFWKGHVAMMLDETRMIHANAHHMAVAIEPLADAIVRIRNNGGGEPTAYRRP